MALSEDSTRVVDALWNHVSELHAEWKTLMQLFGVSAEQSQHLNTVAGALFDTVYRALLRDVLLGISRLTDALKTGGKDNLVLERLQLLGEVEADAALSATVAEKIADVRVKASSIRDYRNKYVAHLDLVAALGPGSSVLPGINRSDVDAALEAMADVFNAVEQGLRDRTVMFKDISIIGGAESLLRHLEDAQSWRGLPRSKRLRLTRFVHGANCE